MIKNTKKGVNVADADAAVGDVKSPSTFYSVAAPKKTGTMPTVALDPANSNYPAGYHAGNAGGLEAVDPDLAVGNIKSGVTIFGKVGTLTPGSLAQDTSGAVNTQVVTDIGEGTIGLQGKSVSAGSEHDIQTLTLTFAATSLAFAAAFAFCSASVASMLKLRLYMNGVNMGESAYLSAIGSEIGYNLSAFAALSGAAIIVKLSVHNYDVSARYYVETATSLNKLNSSFICCGSVKLV